MEDSNQNSRLDRIEAIMESMLEVINNNFVKQQQNFERLQSQVVENQANNNALFDELQKVINSNFVKQRQDVEMLRSQMAENQIKNEALFDELHSVVLKMMKTDETAVASVREIESTIKKTAKVLSEHKAVLSK